MAYSIQGAESSNFSSSNSTPKWKFDVFLSFAGQDTRLNFADHLYAALIRSGIRAFRDNEGIEREVISEQLLQAIEDSLFAIVVLSKNYAYSTWCLDELQKILECKNMLGRQVIPIFYDVDPSDVRNKKQSFGEALAKHEDRFKENKDKVQKWREALVQVSNLSGWDTRGRHEADLIENIVGGIWTYLCSKLPSYNDNLVGINSKMFDMISLLKIGLDNVRFVGVWGMGGMGKTTLVRVVYEKISSQFEMCCFLANIRETLERDDQVHLQREILSHLNISNKKIKDKDEGKTIIRNLFCNKKVLLVLDDINDASQLENLAESPKWFGAGSRVIITTRDIHLLTSSRVRRIYKIEAMKVDEALQLFSKKAFHKDYPEEDYLVLSKSVVKYAGGLPLALHVLGSFLCGRSVHEWEDALDRLNQIPNSNILQRLKISYDALHDEEKIIFLDVACFFKGWKKDKVIQVLKNCGLHPTIGINILIEKALLTEKKSKKGECILEMHDLLQELGRNIIFQESLTAGKRSRLWNSAATKDVLKNNKGSEAIQAIFLPTHDEMEVHSEAFSKMTNLRLLVLGGNSKLPNGLKFLSNALRVVQWENCPLKDLPLETSLDNLVDIQMPFSKIRHLWNGIQVMKSLKFINLSNSNNLIETPNFSGVPNLEKLILQGCQSLVVVHPSLGELNKLVEVNLSCCTSLEILPSKFKINSLINLDLSRCYKVSVLPEFGESMKKLSMLDISYTAITELPESFGFLTGFGDLKLKGCKKLFFRSSFTPMLKKQLTPFIAQSSFNLTSLTMLDLSNCGIKDGSILADFGCLSSLIALDLGGNDFLNLPADCFSDLYQLHYLFLNNCIRLNSMPKLPPRLIRLDASCCDSMEPLSDKQLWNWFSSLDHEYRHRTKYASTLHQHIQPEYSSQRDFLATISGYKIPSWFRNKDHISSCEYYWEHVIKMDIPPCLRASEWSGLAVCLNLRLALQDYGAANISWSSKAPEDDHFILKGWAHYTIVDSTRVPLLYILLLHFNEKTCWQHLRGDNNCLHIKLTIHSRGNMLQILGCGWRVLCKEDMQEWCNNTSECDFDKTTKAEVGTSEVYLPHCVLDRTLKTLQVKSQPRQKEKKRSIGISSMFKKEAQEKERPKIYIGSSVERVENSGGILKKS